MTDDPGVRELAARTVWECEETVEAEADAAFAFRYWTSLAAARGDPGVESIEIDGPFQPGARGVTQLAGGQRTDWMVSACDPEERAAIDVHLDGATVRSEWRFEPRPGGGSLLTQRMSLFGPNAEAYRDEVAAGFGPGMRDGMRVLSRRIDAAAGLGDGPPATPRGRS
jgi:hypothetical protein